MALPVRPPLAPMLARASATLPLGPGWRYEPKWDGFRCLIFRCGSNVDLQSRNQRPLGRYFPELEAAVRALPAEAVVLDGEILGHRDGAVDFEALLRRIHPAPSLVDRLARETPATFVAFDALADARDLRPLPFAERRAVLESVLAEACGPLSLTPVTDEPTVAERWLDAPPGQGIDGVVGKDASAPYQQGQRAMVKVKRQHSADCVVAGCRLPRARSTRAAALAEMDGGAAAVSSLLLGLYDEVGELRHVGVASSFRERQRAELWAELAPLRCPLADHPWAGWFALEGGAVGRLPGSAGRWTPDLEPDWVPLRPERVAEVTYTQLDGRRWRHPGRFLLAP